MQKARGRDFFLGRFGSFVPELNLIVLRNGEARRNDYNGSSKVLLRTGNATLSRTAVAASEPRRPKQPTDFAEGLWKVRAPRKGGSVFEGKRRGSTGSPMEPKPTKAAKHYFPH